VIRAFWLGFLCATKKQMAQDLTCINSKYPGRRYTNKDTLTPDGHSDPGWGNGDGYGAFPQWTYVIGMSGKDQGCNCGGPESSYPGTSWGGCGDCSGGGWDCCGCCIKSWSTNNKSPCCDPTVSPANTTFQNSGLNCDPAWCPWSPQCLADPITEKYCKTNPTDATCLATCMNYASAATVADAPAWCNGFVPTYCRTQSASAAGLSDADQTICACSLAMTPSDECLWPACNLAPDGQTWKTAAQYANAALPTYCQTECQNIRPSVIANDGQINRTQYLQVCGDVPLPSGGTGSGSGGGTNSGGGGNDGGGSDYSPSNLWYKAKTWVMNAPVQFYVGAGVLVFVLLVWLVHALFSHPKPAAEVPAQVSTNLLTTTT